MTSTPLPGGNAGPENRGSLQQPPLLNAERAVHKAELRSSSWGTVCQRAAGGPFPGSCRLSLLPPACQHAPCATEPTLAKKFRLIACYFYEPYTVTKLISHVNVGKSLLKLGPSCLLCKMKSWWLTDPEHQNRTQCRTHCTGSIQKSFLQRGAAATGSPADPTLQLLPQP